MSHTKELKQNTNTKQQFWIPVHVKTKNNVTKYETKVDRR